MFRDRHIVITGGSSGLGLELARLLADEGAHLTLVARDGRKLAQAAAELRRRQPRVRIDVASLDVCDEAATALAMQRIAETGGGFDMLINSAGILREGRFDVLPMRAFRDVMEVNYFGLLNATRAALPYFKAGGGRLVNIASIAGLTGVFGYTPYCASKHALVGVTESLRYELKPKGIHVHLVCPAEFDSPMVEELDRKRTQQNRAHAQTIPKVSAATIAKGTLSGIRANKFFIVPGAKTRLFAFFIRHFPALTRALGDKAVAKAG